MGNGSTPTHWFVVETYNSSTGECTKYDMGSDSRIQTQQPFRTQLDEWDNKDFICAYRVDYAPAGSIVVPDKDGLGERRDITDTTLDKDNNNLVNRMQKSLRGSSYSDLSYLIIPHYDFNGQVQNGEMVVCKDLADEVLLIFQELYKVKYPIERMKLVDEYEADDWISIQNNNTSAFNYRQANDGQNDLGVLSNHAFGKSIDINPLINPYIINYYSASESPYTTHDIEKGPDSRDRSRNYGDRFIYRDQMTGWREIEKQARIARGTNIYNIFTKYGWSWLEYAGGSGEDLDSQHFDKQDTSNVKRIDYAALSSGQNGQQGTTNSASNDTRNILFIGDSRTEEIERTIPSDADFICKVGEGYNWMVNTAFPQAEANVYAGKKVIIWLGVNDLGNIDNYISAVNAKAAEWTSRGAKVYYAEVGPVDSDPYADNATIEDFNRRLQAGLSSNIRIIRLYDKLINEGYTTVDGTHYNTETNQKIYNYLVSSVNGTGSGNGTVTETPFTKYQLTDQELTGLAAVAFSEQGTPEGASREASLMANLFEVHHDGQCYGVTGGAGLYKMVSQPIGGNPYGWFADASNYIDSGHLAPYCGGGPVTDEMKAVVKKVLVDGYRTLPLYVDEHDSWSGKDYRAYLNGADVTYDRSSYIPFTTQIDNNYGSHYTFWGWSNPNYDGSDPFGYTREEYRTKYGEFCYDFDGNAIGTPGTTGADSNVTYYVKVATWSQTVTEVEYTEPGKEGYTTVANNMTSKNINYEEFLSGYTMPFNYLWALVVITEDKDFALELADLVYNSELEITVHDNYTETTTQSSEEYWTTIMVRKSASGDLSPERAMFTKTTTTTVKNNRIETALTRANVWIVDYKQDFVYEKLSNGSKWVAKEKTTREKTDKNDTEDNFVTLLRKNSKAYNALDESADWLFEVIENPDNGITDMLDLTKCLLYKATGTKYDNIDTYDFGAYDPSTFKKSTDGFVGSNIEEKLWWLLKDIGYTDNAAAGAMGNFSAETDDGKEINSDCVESNGEGVGIVQWSFGRKKALLSYAESKGKTWENETIQLEFLKAELTGGGCDGFAEDQCYDKATEARFLAASSPEQAADLFDKLFERSGGSRLDVRERGAKYYYNMFHGKVRPAYAGGSSEIIEVADKYVGNPYVWGGSSLTNGCDCSHFIWLVLKECGKIPQDAAYHYTGEIYSGRLADWGAEYIGKDPNDAEAGDIILYADGNIHHVAFYDGNGLIVEAKGSAWGITHDRTLDHEPIAGIYRVK